MVREKHMTLIILFLLGLISKTCFVESQNSSSVDESSLLALSASLNSDILSTNWTQRTSFCTWIGVNCSRAGVITGLLLSNTGLRGTIPPTIANLSALTVLDLSNNNLTGSIPREIGNLRQLRVFDVSANQLTERLPDSVGSLTNLEGFNVSYNQLSGDIPTGLSENVGLKVFDLSHNGFTGNIPAEFGNLSQLQQFILWKNRFTGEIPSTMFNISSLVTFDVSENQMSGKFPENVCSHPESNLQNLWIYQNQFEGQILSYIIPCRSLQVLSAMGNKFSGNIPSEFSNITTIQMLGLGRNAFTGIIPPSIGSLPNLQIFDIAENSFHGPIPSEIGQLPNLTWLNLKSNFLVGEVPESIFNISTMSSFTLSMNNLTGRLPLSIDRMMPNVRYFILTGNRFDGGIPSSITNLSDLEILDLSNNSFTGEIPSTLGKLSKLTRLTLSNNRFTNNVSKPEQDFLSSLSSCKSLETVNIDMNPLSGVLPASLGSSNLSKSLEQFTAQSCRFVSPLPDEIGNLSNLVALDLGSNELSGSIPRALRNLSKLQKLDLYGNKLEGPILDELCNLNEMFHLDLRENRFFGQIPGCLGSLPKLTEINLANNGFNSSIPSSFWSNRLIQKINFSSNFIDGSLSPRIGSMNSLIELDLSENQISGEIPGSIAELMSLTHLSLSDNRMSGPINESLASLIELQYLDLSENRFSGSIPSSLESLSHLTYFNVSFNELSGEIPDKGPFANFTDGMFAGNKGLCGAPRFKVEACKRSNPKHSDKKKFLKYILPPILGSAALVAFIVLIFLLRRRGERPSSSVSNSTAVRMNENITQQEILNATSNLDETNLIGRGSYGSVYRAEFKEEMVVAVKVFNLDVQGAMKSFDVECQMMHNIRHRNLVKVISSCSKPDFKALVMEYMPNGNLEQWLYSAKHSLNIFQRFALMVDVASAIEYLHEGLTHTVAHCDLKPNNVLLDKDMVAHVADFGIAKLLSQEQRVQQTRTLGTIGYMAPEYGSNGLISAMVDVYSYGIMLMEVITRKKPSDAMFSGELTMRRWVSESYPNSVMQIVDEELLKLSDENVRGRHERCLTSAIEVALECTADLSERPKMKYVAARMNKIMSKLLKH